MLVEDTRQLFVSTFNLSLVLDQILVTKWHFEQQHNARKIKRKHDCLPQSSNQHLLKAAPSTASGCHHPALQYQFKKNTMISDHTYSKKVRLKEKQTFFSISIFFLPPHQGRFFLSTLSSGQRHGSFRSTNTENKAETVDKVSTRPLAFKNTNANERSRKG